MVTCITTLLAVISATAIGLIGIWYLYSRDRKIEDDYAVSPWTSKSEIKKISDLYRPYKAERIKLYLIIKKILQKYDIIWWLDQGSLLSVYRDGKIIEHDVDIDIAVHWETISKYAEFEKILKYELKNSDYIIDIQKPDRGYSIRKETKEKYSASQQEYLFDLIHLDLYFYRYNKKNNCYYHNFINDLGLKEQQKNDILPLKQRLFENIDSNTPNQITKYLKYNYGYIGQEPFRWDKNLKLYIKIK